MFNILVLMKSLTLNKAAFIELKYSKISNISKYYCNLFSIVKYLKMYLFLWCKTDFSALLLQSSVSHDPSEI